MRPFPKLFRAIGLMALALAPVAAVAGATAKEPEEIRLPFGLGWQTTKDTFLEYIAGTGVKVTNKKPDPAGEIWTVEGFIQPDLERALLHFEGDGFLVEVELHYRNRTWDAEGYARRFQELRRRFEASHGIGKLIAFDQRPAEGGAETRLEGYQWAQPFAVLRLILFSAQKEGQTYHNISVHYRVPPEESP